MNLFIVFRTAMCPSCRVHGYGVMHGYISGDFTPCPAYEKVIERILAMEVVEETAL